MNKIFSKGELRIGRIQLSWTLLHTQNDPKFKAKHSNCKLHFGPGDNWIKPGPEWLTLDIDASRADILLNFNEFSKLPLLNESVSSIYGSHVFEHMSIFSAPKVFSECFRVLMPGGFFRLVLPDVRKSIEEYLKGNIEFALFKTRINFAKKRFGHDKFTIFEALKGDFLSPTGQTVFLGETGLAHQNAWDFEAIVCELERAGFNSSQIRKMEFRKTDCKDFEFEGTYPSEANEEDRSIYVEAHK